MAEVVLRDVSKIYADGTHAVRGLDLSIADGEFLVLVGPSGCGKTTALRMVAGLEEITSGEIRIGGRVVNDVPPRDRDVAMVFQSYALYPHLSVRENIAFGLRLRKLPKDEINRKVQEAAKILGLEEYLDRKPRNLSGGQRQRVAMGRAIVRKPQVFLMDEPLSNLDAKLRVQMRAEIARIQRRLGVTTIYVTHDQTEAMTLGDRVAVMKKGELQQVDAPQVLYDYPVNLFVAGFIGSPAMNLFEGRITTAGDGTYQLLAGSQRLLIEPKVFEARPALYAYLDRPVIVGLRPEDMEDASLVQAREGCTLTSTADLVEAMGSDVLVHFGIDAPKVVTDDTKELARDAGTDVLGALDERGHSVLVARFSPRTRVREGGPVTVHVATDRLHFFDPKTGTSIWNSETAGAGTASARRSTGEG
ncbi:sn-glycerol-3-phosphate ABC transporter ATP-binding protein UgpC [Carbonactinospora thermoautotrophica]|uniref:ABC transporter related protein n=1 Tax=Carbonactinospora thermoautotrophica TaxID=1469144 RepID=A0A132MWQ4_9ACTN|nr:sn-glycerol-3-phosphate ABC transporter ATP-binding protein UgpC [Carbonactinospora thermoautotrophica]KWX02291.1 ABC transporter related protein [Carbonactinospora thermoautotrophica]MCX9190178.1 sn-glycerol-3-phosphate ABC transporter ATP-binding protein UgpC [Carbonactinospora thermoautotrophica]